MGTASTAIPQPVILLAVARPDALADVLREVDHRYSHDYRLLTASTTDEAASLLRSVSAEGGTVAILISDTTDPLAGSSTLFTLARDLFPEVRRCLLIEWGSWDDPAVADTVFRMMESLQIHYYAVRPLRTPDEAFHRRITEFLLEWQRSETVPSGEAAVAVIGSAALPRTHQVVAQLARFGIRHTVLDPGSVDAHRILAGADPGAATGDVVVRLADGRLVVDPSDTELARAFSFTTDIPDEQVDLAIVGAGPAGLAAAVYAASEGLRTVVIERAAVGGQAGSSSLIRNYLGFERGIGGAELAQRSYQQAWAFGARFALTREAVGLDTSDGFRLAVAPSDMLLARAVVLATGVSYRRLDLGDLSPYVGTAVFYGAAAVEARAQAGRTVHVIGGGNSAGQAALHLGRYAASVTLIIRGRTLADSMSAYLIRQLEDAGVQIMTEAKVVGGAISADRADRLDHILVRDRSSGRDAEVRSDALFVTIGASPHTAWLPENVLRDRWGFVITGDEVLTEGGRRAWPLERAPRPLESSVPGLFAVGDARRGSVKRVASAVGEGLVVVSSVHAFLAERSASD
ncbi:MAG: FAD-dependent oxidoreductase [Leifsonia sp.]